MCSLCLVDGLVFVLMCFGTGYGGDSTGENWSILLWSGSEMFSYLIFGILFWSSINIMVIDSSFSTSSRKCLTLTHTCEALSSFFFLYQIGRSTKTYSFVAWVIVMSIHGRNQLIGHGGDATARLLLFFTALTDSCSRFSYDSVMYNRSLKHISVSQHNFSHITHCFTDHSSCFTLITLEMFWHQNTQSCVPKASLLQ